jgi:hypothetical protein
MERRVPLQLLLAHCFGRGTLVFSMLRAWRLDPRTGAAIVANRSVRHEAIPEYSAEVLPSGFFVEPRADGSVEVSYLVEIELGPARRAAGFAPDAQLLRVVASIFVRTVAGLVDHLEAQARARAAEGSRAGA